MKPPMSALKTTNIAPEARERGIAYLSPKSIFPSLITPISTETSTDVPIIITIDIWVMKDAIRNPDDSARELLDVTLEVVAP